MIRFGDDIMNYKVRNLIVITFIVIISFFLKIDKIGALTCEYEMYPVNYKNVKDELLAVDGNLKSTAKLTYITNGDGNDEYSLEHVATFGDRDITHIHLMKIVLIKKCGKTKIKIVCLVHIIYLSKKIVLKL